MLRLLLFARKKRGQKKKGDVVDCPKCESCKPQRGTPHVMVEGRDELRTFGEARMTCGGREETREGD